MKYLNEFPTVYQAFPVPTDYTHFKGSLIDQVLTRETFMYAFMYDLNSIYSCDINVYFSDHDAMRVQFKPK